MGLFDLFKKKKNEFDKHYDPVNIKVTDLEKGYLLDYDLETWTVTKMSEYDWGNNFFSREFQIESGDKIRFLSIEEDDKLIISISESLKYRKIGPKVIDYIELNGKPPKEIDFNGITYYLDEESPGFYRNVETENWEELISFYYLNEDEDLCLTIEQWDDNDFDISYGKLIKDINITNILPAYND